MSKFKVGDIIEHAPEYEPTESGLYLITKVTKYEYELTTTVEPFERYMIHKSMEDWGSIKLV
jgi:hypothetical protein